MKTIITLNWRPLCRALCTLLLGIAALWAMPNSAQAQALLVSQSLNGSVNEYDATTGALIEANFISGFVSPSGMLVSGNTLYVASGEVNGGFINTYDATTGALTEANFISSGAGGFGTINGAANLALSGNTLYVVNNFADTVTTYDATTGAPIAAPLIYGGTTGTSLGYPFGLAISGNNLYVSNNYSGTDWVGKYDLSGAPINDHFINTPGVGAYGLAISNNHLFVATGADGGTSVEEYDATTGALLNGSFISGLQYGYGLTIFGNTLYVAQNYGRPDGTSVVSKYDVNTGALLNANFVTGLNGGDNFMVVVPVPEPSTWSMIGVGGVALLGIMLRKRHRTFVPRPFGLVQRVPRRLPAAAISDAPFI